MSSAPVLLDLYCGGGGAAMGYHLAGFKVIGVDVEPQPLYPFEFHKADALEFLATESMSNYSAIHASPPCQRYSQGAGSWGTRERHKDLIGATRQAVITTGLPYIIENIYTARRLMVSPTMLCGTMFDLGVFRHRMFEANFRIEPLGHDVHRGRIGDGRYFTVAGKPGGSSTRDGVKFGSTADWRRAMGIDWLNSRSLAQSIPPEYTRHVGLSLVRHLAVSA